MSFTLITGSLLTVEDPKFDSRVRWWLEVQRFIESGTSERRQPFGWGGETHVGCIRAPKVVPLKVIEHPYSQCLWIYSTIQRPLNPRCVTGNMNLRQNCGWQVVLGETSLRAPTLASHTWCDMHECNVHRGTENVNWKSSQYRRYSHVRESVTFARLALLQIGKRPWLRPGWTIRPWANDVALKTHNYDIFVCHKGSLVASTK